jgi:pantetheine-phosphate adenylyltransferase
MKNKVIYPGTFDPITLGHADLIKRATHLFDTIVIAVAKNNAKNPIFSLQERIDLIKSIFKDSNQIEVLPFDGLLVNFAKTHEIKAILRGLRVVSDFDYEFQMASMNRVMKPHLETIFLTPADKYTYISSTLVRTIAKEGGEVSAFVPSLVAKALKEKFS